MKQIIYIILGILFLIGAGYGFSQIPSQPGQYDKFATCVTDSGATFWGTFWCPYCNDQKALFGKSAKLLPYQECSTPDGNGQVAVCNEAQIQSYPTWDFADGTRQSGVLSFDQLSEITGCQLPENSA